MRVRWHVPAHAHFRARKTGVIGLRRVVKSLLKDTQFVRTNDRGNARPGEVCPLFFAARAAARWEKRPDDNTNPGEIVFDGPSEANRCWWPKSRAHPHETRRSSPDAALLRPARNAEAWPAC